MTKLTAARKARLRLRNNERKAILAARIAEQNGLCAYCGEPMLVTAEERRAAATFNHPRRVTLDHRIPLAGGGEDVAANIVAACLECNGRKGATA